MQRLGRVFVFPSSEGITVTGKRRRMANRGMLPKFRPVSLGANASARPTIRPVKPAPPPPPPSPPRRFQSGVSARKADGQIVQLPRLASAEVDEVATAVGPQEPPTMANPRLRANAMALSFE